MGRICDFPCLAILPGPTGPFPKNTRTPRACSGSMSWTACHSLALWLLSFLLPCPSHRTATPSWEVWRQSYTLLLSIALWVSGTSYLLKKYWLIDECVVVLANRFWGFQDPFLMPSKQVRTVKVSVAPVRSLAPRQLFNLVPAPQLSAVFGTCMIDGVFSPFLPKALALCRHCLQWLTRQPASALSADTWILQRSTGPHLRLVPS